MASARRVGGAKSSVSVTADVILTEVIWMPSKSWREYRTSTDSTMTDRDVSDS